MNEVRPIISTLIVDGPSHDRFQRLRNRYYPASRVPAHVTLFRKLPGQDPETTISRVQMAVNQQPPFPIEVGAPEGLRNGVALPIYSPKLIEFRRRIADEFEGELRPDDRKPFEPHMTIQHRVTRRRALRTLGAVRANFTPFTAEACGISLWFYQKGRWVPLEKIELATH